MEQRRVVHVRGMELPHSINNPLVTVPLQRCLAAPNPVGCSPSQCCWWRFVASGQWFQQGRGEAKYRSSSRCVCRTDAAASWEGGSQHHFPPCQAVFLRVMALVIVLTWLVVSELFQKPLRLPKEKHQVLMMIECIISNYMNPGIGYFPFLPSFLI